MKKVIINEESLYNLFHNVVEKAVKPKEVYCDICGCRIDDGTAYSAAPLIGDNDAVCCFACYQNKIIPIKRVEEARKRKATID